MGTAFVSMNAISEDYHDYLALRERGEAFLPKWFRSRSIIHQMWLVGMASLI